MTVETRPVLNGDHTMSFWLRNVKRAAIGPRIPLHRHEAFGPFFIVGAPRSGNTLMRRILQTSSMVHIPPETYVLGEIAYNFRLYSHLPWEQVVPLVLSTLEYYPSFESFELSLRPLANRLNELPKEQQSLAQILDSFYRFHADHVGNKPSIWGDKTPLNVQSMGGLVAIFPDARFLLMVRDGADSIHSHLKSGLEQELSRASQRWTDAQRAMRQLHRQYPDQSAYIRYEQLVTRPEIIVKQACDLLNIPFDKAILEPDASDASLADVSAEEYSHLSNVLKPISSSSVGKGRAAWSRGQRQQLGRLINEELSASGYEPLL